MMAISWQQQFHVRQIVFILTGDKDLLVLKKYKNMNIISQRDSGSWKDYS